MPQVPRTQVSAPIGEAEARSLQTDYRVYLHEVEGAQGGMHSPLVEKPIYGKTARTRTHPFSKIGSEPTKYWGAQDGKIHKLLIQIRESDDVTFEKKSGTPHQQAYQLYADDPECYDWPYYKLVGGLPIYIFATHDETSAFLVTGRF